MRPRHGEQKSVAYRQRLVMLAPGLAFLLLFTWRSSSATSSGRMFTLFDDSMISMTYARTFAETGEFVWFPGAPRVQGFTNPLWTLYMALIHLIGLQGSAAALTVTATGILLVLGCGLVVERVVRLAVGGSAPGRAAALIAGGGVPLLYPLVFWTLRGMEVGLLALLSLLMVERVAVASRRWQEGGATAGPLLASGLIGLVGVTVRLDFAIIAGGLAAWLFWWAPKRDERIRVVLLAGVPLVLAGVGILLFQRGYYGDWVPNTYRLKMEGFSLQDRLTRGLVATGRSLPVLVMTAVGVAVMVRSDGLRRRLAFALSTVVGLMAAYSVWVGGDAWEWMGFPNRYLTTAVPAFIAVIGLAAGQLLERGAGGLGRSLPAAAIVVLSGVATGLTTNPIDFLGRRAALFMVVFGGVVAVGVLCVRWAVASPRPAPSVAAIVSLVAAGVLAVSFTSGYVWLLAADYPHTVDDAAMSRDGRELERVTEPEARIATMWAGAPAYYAHRPMIDLLGKSDRRIAAEAPRQPLAPSGLSWFFPGHNKWDYDYSVGELRPDIVFQIHEWDRIKQQLASWGYEKRCLPDGTSLYARTDSKLVHWAELATCPA